MSIFTKIKDFIDPTDAEIEQDEEMSQQETVSVPEKKVESAAPQAPVAAPKNVSYGSSLELKVVRPDGFDNVTSIADYLLSKKTVVLNLDDTNNEATRRLLDFLTGVAYAINGNIKKASKSTYIITPNNVSISGEQLKDTTEHNDTSSSQLF